MSEARKAVTAEPTRWGAAIYEGKRTPLTEQQDTVAHLFVHVKTAEEELRARVNELVEQGYKRIYGGVSKRLVALRRGHDQVWLGLDKRRR